MANRKASISDILFGTSPRIMPSQESSFTHLNNTTQNSCNTQISPKNASNSCIQTSSCNSFNTIAAHLPSENISPEDSINDYPCATIVNISPPKLDHNYIDKQECIFSTEDHVLHNINPQEPNSLNSPNKDSQSSPRTSIEGVSDRHSDETCSIDVQERPNSGSVVATTILGEQDDVIKWIRKGDMFNVFILLPFYIEKLKTRLSPWNIFFLKIHVYSCIIFMVFASITLSLIVAKSSIKAHENISVNGHNFTDFDLYRLVCFIITSILLVMTIITEIKSSLSPTLNTWKVVQTGEWTFDYEKIDDNVIIKKLSGPAWDIYPRFITAIITQFVIYIILLLSAVTHLYTIDNDIDIIKDSFAFVFILQIDEYIFQYIAASNSYFLKIWRDDSFGETVFVYNTKKIKQKTNHIVRMILSSIFVIFISIVLLSAGNNYIMHIIFNNKETTTFTPSIEFDMSS